MRVARHRAGGPSSLHIHLFLWMNLAVVSRTCGFLVNRAGVLTPDAVRMKNPMRVSTSRAHEPTAYVRRRASGQPAATWRVSKPMMSSSGDSPGFVEKVVTAWGTVIPQGDPDAMPPCPSGVSELPKPLQVSTRTILLVTSQISSQVVPSGRLFLSG